MPEFALVALAFAAATIVALALPQPPFTPLSIGLLYLLVVIVLSLRVGRWPMLLAGLLSAVTWEFFFVAPRYHFRIGDLSDGLLVAIHLVVALVAGQLADRVRQQTRGRRRTEESERLQRALLDGVSHELRTPLAVITAALDSLGEDPPAGREPLVREMAAAIRRLNRLVGNLLNQTRLEAGTVRPRLDWADPAEILHAALNDTRDSLAGRDVSVEIAPDMPPMRLDAVLTEHALANLILNAGVHTPAGTPVHVSAGLLAGGGRVRFAVADRGFGVPAEVREALFRKFTRSPRSAKGGLGLGLSIARGFVAAQGGEVALTDNPGGGALFALSLPVQTARPEDSE